MSSPQVYLGNGVQTRFDVPGSVSKVVRVNGVVTPPASSDAQSVTLSVAPGVGVPVQIDWVGTVQPAASGGLPPGGAASTVLTKVSGTDGDATWSPSSGGAAAVTLTSSTNLTAAAHANRTIYADSTAAMTLTIQTGGWVDGDTVYVIAKNLSTGVIAVTDLLGAVKPNYQPQMNSAGQSMKLRFDAVTAKWQSVDTPVFQASGSTSTMAVASNGASLHYSINGYADIKFQTSNIQIQAGNSGYNGAPVDCRIFSQSTLTNARPAAQVTAGAQWYSHCRIGTETTYYEDSRRVSMYLHTTPIPNIETVFPGSTETGERNRFVVSGGQGLIIGSDMQNSYNGKWSQYDTWGNAAFLRSWGNASRQKDVATTGTVTIGMGVTNLILAGSGTVTVALPASPYDGQIASLQIRTAYTSISIIGNGAAVTPGTAVGITAGAFASWRYDAADFTWDRMS